ncbi:MAG: diacylglycerol kinase family lipid kinase [Acidobacteria bacterium]|nr:diacylglycerol kinase family lipid kinase [Acidobacteriota bacterium]
MDSGKKKLLIYNPAAGRRVSSVNIERLCRQFYREGWTVEPRPTPKPNSAQSIIRDCREEIAGVIVLGGDGTINETLPAVVNTPLFLAVLPGGTANVLAREIKMPRRLSAAVSAIVRGTPVPVTIGQANGRYFVAFLGIGFDAHVSAEVSLALKRHIGRGAYVWEAMRQLFRYEFPEARFHIAADEYPAAFGVVANSRLYGGNLLMAPRASLQSPELDLCLFQAGPPASYFRYLVQVLFRRHLAARGVHYRKADHIRIESDQPVRYQVDGEPAGFLPLTVHSLPGALRLVLPGGCVSSRTGQTSGAGPDGQDPD